ncbi:hypothetical protein GGI23_003535 [Coemansia sp. RSA 2559]|nr:hypothetical protein GGI23_003535 [Coemansia sp. RSA 2559]
MSATATLTTSAHSLCLFSKHPPSPHQQQPKQVSARVDGSRGDKDKHLEPSDGRDGSAKTHQDLSCPETQPAPSTKASTTPALSPPASSLTEHSLAASDEEDCPETPSSRQSDYATDSSWPRAVDALAQRLWDCGRDPLSHHDFSSSSASSSSSNFPSATQIESAMTTASFKLSTKGSFMRRGAADASAADSASDKESDEDSVLCDGPYVHVNYAVAPSEMPATLPSGHAIMLQQKQQKKSTKSHQTWQQQQQQQQQKIMQGHPLTSRRALRIPPPFSATNNGPSSLYLTPMSAPESKSLHQDPRAICDRLQLIHYQPVSNPFKTMAKSATASPTTACSLKPIAPPPSSSSSAETMGSPPATASSATSATARAEKKTGHYFSNQRQRELLPSLVSPMSLRSRPAKRHHRYEQDDIAQLPALPPPLATRLAAKHGCVHCKRGNFLEFCFVNDRCICKCHSDCPCNPCTTIRSHRSTLSSSATQNSFFTESAMRKAVAAVGEDAYARRSVAHAATSATPMSAVDPGAAITTDCHT